MKLFKMLSALTALIGIGIALFFGIVMAFAPETVGLGPALIGEALIAAGGLGYKAADSIKA